MTDEPDILGAPYTAETIDLPDDAEGPVRRDPGPAPGRPPTRRAVLHVHGFADYFFQTEYAEWWNARGYDFYALDLRKYGRSILAHQTPNYVTDLRDYFPELDEAWEPGHRARRARPRRAHRRTPPAAWSLPLWADDRGRRAAPAWC